MNFLTFLSVATLAVAFPHQTSNNNGFPQLDGQDVSEVRDFRNPNESFTGQEGRDGFRTQSGSSQGGPLLPGIKHDSELRTFSQGSSNGGWRQVGQDQQNGGIGSLSEGGQRPMNNGRQKGEQRQQNGRFPPIGQGAVSDGFLGQYSQNGQRSPSFGQGTQISGLPQKQRGQNQGFPQFPFGGQVLQNGQRPTVNK
ncbi:hypothetical protein RB195_001688 [Necator americanus]|uniref:Uncharacterized protein n=1 Tax=Necator americanus TaxID=51031 RepID=A0ABR1DGD1_NECAM